MISMIMQIFIDILLIGDFYIIDFSLDIEHIIIDCVIDICYRIL